MCHEAASSKAAWYEQLMAELFASHSAPAAVKDILSVADSRELRIIYRIAQETTAVLDLDTLLSRIVTIIREVMGYYMVSILLPVNEASELRVGAHSGYAVDITGLTVAVGASITGWVYKNAVPHIVPDVHADARYIGLDDQVRSELAFPLMSRGRVVGVLNAESQHVDAFSEADVGLMSAVGSQLASYLEVAQLHDTLKREASHDPLTRLNNRRHFLERIQQEIARSDATGETFSIVFLDVDELKRINDTYGHLAGDALLREVSNALMDAVRGEDVVARYGGDEFVVLLPATPASAATSVAQRISGGIARHRFTAGGELKQRPAPPEAVARDAIRDALRHAGGRGGRRCGQQDHELVAAVAGHDILAAHCVHQRIGYFAKEGVAREMAIRVIDSLELIHVQEDDGEALIGSTRADHLLLNPLEEETSIIEPRQRIVTGLALQGVVQLRHFEIRGELRANRRHKGNVRLGKGVGVLALRIEHAHHATPADQRKGELRVNLLVESD